MVEHLHVQDDGEESLKLIGVYSSNENAGKAVERLRLQPGFCDTPDGFTIDPYTLDERRLGVGLGTRDNEAE